MKKDKEKKNVVTMTSGGEACSERFTSTRYPKHNKLEDDRTRKKPEVELRLISSQRTNTEKKPTEETVFSETDCDHKKRARLRPFVALIKQTD